MTFGMKISDLLANILTGDPKMDAAIHEAFPQPKNSLRFSNLKRGQHQYLIVGEHGKTEYCYTPHRASDGYFYTFEYVEVWRSPLMKTKKGREQLAKSRTPYARCAMKHLTKSRSRKLARSRAEKRYRAAVARAGWKISPRGCRYKDGSEAAKALPAG